MRIVQDAHASTWFTIASNDQCFHTNRGSRPGSPLADVAYNILMRELLTELAAGINSLASIVQVNEALQMSVPVLAWVDEVAIPIPTTRADQRIEVVQTVLNIAPTCVRVIWAPAEFSTWKDRSGLSITWTQSR